MKKSRGNRTGACLASLTTEHDLMRLLAPKSTQSQTRSSPRSHRQARPQNRRPTQRSEARKSPPHWMAPGHQFPTDLPRLM